MKRIKNNKKDTNREEQKDKNDNKEKEKKKAEDNKLSISGIKR